MNVKELIDKLQSQDPAAHASDALVTIQAAEEAAARAYLLTPPGVRAHYAELLAHAKVHKDSEGNGNDPAECAKHAFNGVRTNVHWALQCRAGAPPGPHPDDEGDPEIHHMRQKLHFKKLWKETDALVLAAGVTEKGLVS